MKRIYPLFCCALVKTPSRPHFEKHCHRSPNVAARGNAASFMSSGNTFFVLCCLFPTHLSTQLWCVCVCVQCSAVQCRWHQIDEDMLSILLRFVYLHMLCYVAACWALQATVLSSLKVFVRRLSLTVTVLFSPCVTAHSCPHLISTFLRYFYDECYMAFCCSHTTIMDSFSFLFVCLFLQEFNK